MSRTLLAVVGLPMTACEVREDTIPGLSTLVVVVGRVAAPGSLRTAEGRAHESRLGGQGDDGVWPT